MKYVRPLYRDSDGGIEMAIGPAESKGELREMFRHRSSYARSLRAGSVVPAYKVNAAKWTVPSGYCPEESADETSLLSG